MQDRWKKEWSFTYATSLPWVEAHHWEAMEKRIDIVHFKVWPTLLEHGPRLQGILAKLDDERGKLRHQFQADLHTMRISTKPAKPVKLQEPKRAGPRIASGSGDGAQAAHEPEPED